MANASSIIRVSIIGDVKKMVGAFNEADKASSGLLKSTVKSVGTAFVTLKAIDKGFDFVNDSLGEWDRLGDAITRTNISLGLLGPFLKETAGDFKNIGASTADMLELEAAFVGLGTAVGILQAPLLATAENAAATATAISLLEDVDPSAVIDQIAKAANGNAKAMQALEISVSDADVVLLALQQTGRESAKELTKGELATARLSLVLDALKPKLVDAQTATGDLEIAQKRMSAQVEDLQAKLGEKLAPALVTVLGFINDEIDAIPGAIKGFQMLGNAIENMARQALSPLASLVDLLNQVHPPSSSGFDQNAISRQRSRESSTVRNQQDFDERNGNSRSVNNRIGGP